MAPDLIAGPLLFAAQQWVIGAGLIVVAVGGGVCLRGRVGIVCRSDGSSSSRPASYRREPVVLADTLALRTGQVADLGLAGDTQAADLTGPASGYAIEVTTTQTITAVFVFTPAEPNGRAIHLTLVPHRAEPPGRRAAGREASRLPVT